MPAGGVPTGANFSSCTASSSSRYSREPAPLLPCHEPAGERHHDEDDAEKHRRERIDLRGHADPYARIDGHRQGRRRWAGDKARYDQIVERQRKGEQPDRKSTRLNSSHLVISYAVFCLKKKT